MSIRMRHTKSHRNSRRAHINLKEAPVSMCQKCKAPIRPHAVCTNCGTYKGREVIDVLAKLTKKERKQKEKELHQDNQQAEPAKDLSPEELAKK